MADLRSVYYTLSSYDAAFVFAARSRDCSLALQVITSDLGGVGATESTHLKLENVFAGSHGELHFHDVCLGYALRRRPKPLFSLWLNCENIALVL